MRPARGHKVHGLYGSQCNHRCIPATVTHDTDRFDGQENRKGLRGLVIQPLVIQRLNEDIVGPTQNVGVLFFHFTQNANAQTRSRERMTPDHIVRQTQGLTNHAHLVFKQLTQRFDQLKI